jgi:hypothetical protein
MMTILDEFVQSLNHAIQEYEQANRNSITLERVKTIAEVKAEMESNHTALTLRHALATKVDSMPGLPLVLPIALDLNGLRRRLRLTLDNNKFSQKNIFMKENQEMLADRIKLSKQVQELTEKVERGGGEPNPLITKLELQVTNLAERLTIQETYCQKLQIENKFLSEQLSSTEKERDACLKQLAIEEDKSRQLYASLAEKNTELQELRRTIERLEKQMPSPKGTDNPVSTYTRLYKI